MVSITRVKVSPDLAEAQVFASIMPARYERSTMSGLRRAAGRIRRMTHERVALKTMPRLRFELDQSLKKQSAVYEAIDQGLSRTGADSHEEADVDTDTPDAGEEA